MAFIQLRNGSMVRTEFVTAIRVHDAAPAGPYSPELHPRVVVDWVAGGSFHAVVLDCKTDLERDVLAASLREQLLAAEQPRRRVGNSKGEHQ